MKIGYARVSTDDQNPDLQLTALKAAGCERVFTDKATGASAKRPPVDPVALRRWQRATR
ncbi:recombinase family protein [Methylomagnum ishizawai]|uniref:recombinase family protein n=1 Tax=Methylomagnum ishizawai TaxID=1760988 RepID=UPI0020CAD4E4|nr:recombinase family protein [Methylomagnum ishizawai]